MFYIERSLSPVNFLMVCFNNINDMRKNFIPLLGLLFIFYFLSIKGNAQLINDGGTITISNGASIISHGSITNISGVILNDGKLQTRGSFVNTGTYHSTANEDSLLLTDSGIVTLNGGSSTLRYLIVNKAGGGVTLSGNTTIGSKFNFVAGSFSTDPSNNYELIAPVSTVFSFSAGTEITGKLRRTNWTNGTPVTFHQPNMIISTTGGTAPESFMVNMVPNGDPDAPEREVKRPFDLMPDGGTNYTADITFPYNTAELNTNTEANLVPWYYASLSEWNGKLTGNTINTASHYIKTTGIPANLLTNKWKLADPGYTFNITALLRGAWNGSGMSTALNNAGLLPLSQPYNLSPFNYAGSESVAAIPNSNVVDWVLLELRKPLSLLAADATSSTIVGRKAAFLLNTGAIVNLDGVTPASFNISKQGASFVVVRHLNHLGVMSNPVASNEAGNFTNDFSVISNIYKNSSLPGDAVTLLSGGKYGLWSGDANKNGVVNATDVSAIKSAIANSATGYLLTDVNLSNSINATDISATKATISLSGTGNVNGRTATIEVKTSVPK